MKKIVPGHITSVCLLVGCLLFVSNLGAQSCNDRASILTLSNSKQFYLHDQITTSNGSRVYCGMIYQGSDTSALLLYHNDRGDVQWVKSFKNNLLPRCYFHKVKELRDGNFLVTGRTTDAADMFEYLIIAKFDAAGNLLWYRLFEPGSFSYTESRTVSLQVTEDDFGALYFSFYSTSHNFSAVASLDANGSLIWSRSFRYGNSTIPHFAIAFMPVTVKNDTLFLAGMGQRDQFTMKLNRHTGALQSVKEYSIGPLMPTASLERQFTIRVFLLANGHSISLVRVHYQYPHRYFFVEWDERLNFVKAFALDMPNLRVLNEVFSFSVLPDGTIVAATPFVNDPIGTAIKKIYVAAFNAQQQQVFQKVVSLRREDYILDKSIDNSFLGTDQNGRLMLTPIFSEMGKTAMDIYSYTPDSFRQDCIRDEDSVFTAVSYLSMQERPFSFDEMATDALHEVSAAATVSNESFTKTVVCEKAGICDLLTIKGPNQVCVENGPAIFTASKNDDCLRQVIWDFDSMAADSSRQINDSTIHLFFSKDQQGQIRAHIEGCSIADTIDLKVDKAADAQLRAGDNIQLCIGQNDTLSPGNNFYSYLWQDGSTAKKITIESPGAYWVRVTDTNGCVSADTVIISALHRPPRDFIIADTVICKFGGITLQPQGDFTSWHWSTGATTPSIKVTDEGTYSITVTDRNNCDGTEQVKVTTINCANHIFFPNAFSPNGDGKNDLFKPVTSGNILNYRLQVFNRWGQRVFESTDPAVGWSGRTAASLQSSGIYVWQATVLFAGESIRLMKGTIILFR